MQKSDHHFLSSVYHCGYVSYVQKGISWNGGHGIALARSLDKKKEIIGFPRNSNYVLRKGVEPMSEELLTIAEISRRIGIPESNLRYYRNKFAEFIPMTGKGHKRKYRPDAEGVFKFIAELIAEGRNANEVAELARHRFTETIEIQNETAKVSTTTPQLDIIDLFMAQQKQISEQQLQIAALREEIAATSTEQNTIKERLKTQDAMLDKHFALVDQRLRELAQWKAEPEPKKCLNFWKWFFHIE